MDPVVEKNRGKKHLEQRTSENRTESKKVLSDLNIYKYNL